MMGWGHGPSATRHGRDSDTRDSYTGVGDWTRTLDMQYYPHALHVTQAKIIFCVQVYNFKTWLISNMAAQNSEDWDKSISVEILACPTQKMDLVIPFIFQVLSEHRDAPAAPASLVHNN